jgi:hypothetical protein
VIAHVAATVVLGSSAFAPHGAGFGTAHPHRIFNGGDPNGMVSSIHWTGWGSATARGRGLNPIFRPQGGYFAQRARVRLRAQRLGRCGSVPAYTKLYIRFPQWPGGPLGPWWPWAGAKTICGGGGIDASHPPGYCGRVGGSADDPPGTVFSLAAYRLRCRTAKQAAAVLAQAGCGAGGCRRRIGSLRCRLERVRAGERTPFGNHPAQRMACVRASANFTAWLARRGRT